MIKFHYALQTCDISVRDNNEPRYAATSKTEITKKCVTSFLLSVETCAGLAPDTEHTICIFDDHSTNETLEFLKRAVTRFNKNNVNVSLVNLQTRGLFSSVRACYDWLEINGKDIVYQIQDDYLYTPNAIFEMTDVWMQVYHDTNQHIIISPYNHPHYWRDAYKYRATPRVIHLGSTRYWVQLYEIPCTFFTSKEQFSKHWDLYENFFNGDLYDSKLEINSFNKILTERNVLCLEPIESVALHMQTEFDKDPFIDWKSRWDAVPNI
jgi:hypothetical protein